MSWIVEAYICIESRCDRTDDLVRIVDEHGQPFGPFCREHGAVFMKRTEAQRKKKKAGKRKRTKK